VYLAVISLIPLLLMSRIPGFTFYFGGTSLLIVVGVAMDTAAQLESYQVMRNYDGFLERGRVRGRTPFAGAAGRRG
jgi:preprotein translocase subunit SecY